MRVRKGNSLHDDIYARDTNKTSRGIERWVKVMFKKSFHSAGKTLEIGRQRGDSSCGICVVNSVEHHMFGTLLFTHSEPQSRVFRTLSFVHTRMSITVILSGQSIPLVPDCGHIRSSTSHRHNFCARHKITQLPPPVGHCRCLIKTGGIASIYPIPNTSRAYNEI